MKKLLFLITLLFVTKVGFSQTCYGKHTDKMVLGTTKNGIEFYYKINHCFEGDEVLIQVKNTTHKDVNVSFVPKVVSANQIYTSNDPSVMSVDAKSSLIPNTECNDLGTSLEIIGKNIFPNEYYPTHRQYPSILEFEFTNITVY